MNQDFMQNEEQSRASISRPPLRRPAIPGTWAALIIAAISGSLFGLLTRTDDAQVGGAGSAIASISDVAPDEVDAALGTIAGSPEQLDRFRARKECERHLAWVTLTRASGQQPGRIRLQSGRYYSPLFELAEAPVRVAIPYPAPYQTGHGTLAVVGTTADAVIALAPPWHVPAQPGMHQINVRWKPTPECATQ